MNKILMMALAGLVVGATPVLADNHGEGKKGGADRFAKHDTNGDGSISEAEFLAHAKAKFAAKDTNGDGSISKDEAKAARDKKRAEMKEKHGEKRDDMRKKMHKKMKEKRQDKAAE